MTVLLYPTLFQFNSWNHPSFHLLSGIKKRFYFVSHQKFEKKGIKCLVDVTEHAICIATLYGSHRTVATRQKVFSSISSGLRFSFTYSTEVVVFSLILLFYHSTRKPIYAHHPYLSCLCLKAFTMVQYY